jgi:catechol-2,3-dioxygenase
MVRAVNAAARTSRRGLLAASALGAVSLVLPAARGEVMDEPRILALELLTAAPLRALKEFYHGALGLRVTAERDDRLTIAGGATPITFAHAPVRGDAAAPFYHFAFNIPQDKIRAARDWQRKRSDLLPIPPALRDPSYPDDVVNYSHWNAHSVFFFDPAGNVVEYIARHDLRNDAGGDFDERDILYASEIAFVTDDVAALSQELKRAAGVEQYRSSSDQFAALGDEHGLLLVMKRGRVISFDAPHRKAVNVFKTTAHVRGARVGEYRATGYPYELQTSGR